ncbi:hypothetical protein T439DRAFT_355746 [Meredithblackwellia eburnea MCA 4105]
MESSNVTASSLDLNNLPPRQLGSKAGAIFIAAFLSIYLTATTNFQGYRYFCTTLQSYKPQLIVAFLLLISTAQTALVCLAVSPYRSPDDLTRADWDLIAHYAIFVVISFCVELYYATKLSTLFSGRRARIFVGAVILFSLAQLGFAIAATYTTSQLPETSDLLSRLLVETNALTLACTIVNVVLFFVIKGQGVSIAFAIIIPKLYLFSMLSNISRPEEPLRGVGSGQDSQRGSLSDMFKGKPLFKGGRVSRSKIGMPLPVPVSNNAFDPPPPGSPTWQKATVQSPSRVINSTNTTSLTPPRLHRDPNTNTIVSGYGDAFSTSLYLGTPKTYGEGVFSRQRESPSASTSEFTSDKSGPSGSDGASVESHHVKFAVVEEYPEEWNSKSNARRGTSPYGYI